MLWYPLHQLLHYLLVKGADALLDFSNKLGVIRHFPAPYVCFGLKYRSDVLDVSQLWTAWRVVRLRHKRYARLLEQLLRLTSVMARCQVRPKQDFVSTVFFFDEGDKPLVRALFSVGFTIQGTSTLTEEGLGYTSFADGRPRHYFLRKLFFS